MLFSIAIKIIIISLFLIVDNKISTKIVQNENIKFSYFSATSKKYQMLTFYINEIQFENGMIDKQYKIKCSSNDEHFLRNITKIYINNNMTSYKIKEYGYFIDISHQSYEDIENKWYMFIYITLITVTIFFMIKILASIIKNAYFMIIMIIMMIINFIIKTILSVIKNACFMIIMVIVIFIIKTVVFINHKIFPISENYDRNPKIEYDHKQKGD